MNRKHQLNTNTQNRQRVHQRKRRRGKLTRFYLALPFWLKLTVFIDAWIVLAVLVFGIEIIVDWKILFNK